MKYSTRFVLILSLICSGNFSHAGKTLEQEAWEWFLLTAGLNTGRQLLLTWYDQGTEVTAEDDLSSSEEEMDELESLFMALLKERAEENEAARERFLEEQAALFEMPTPIVDAPLTADEFEARLTAYENGNDPEFAHLLYDRGFYGDAGPDPYDPTNNPYTPVEFDPRDYFPEVDNTGFDREFWERTMQEVPVDLYQDGGKQYGTRIDELRFPSDNNGNIAPLPPGSFLWEEGDETSLRSGPHALVPVKGKVFKNDGKTRHSIFSRGNGHHQTSCLRGPGPLSGSRAKIGEYPKGLSCNGYRHTDPNTKTVTSFDRGHGIDFNDGTLDSTHALDNYTPQNSYYNRSVRGPLVRNIIKSGHFYIEIAIYAAEPKTTKDGTPIPEGFLFIHRNAAGETQNVYYFPNWWNYKAQIKAHKNKGERPYKCILRVCSIEDPKLKAFAYKSALANEEINAHINEAFARARDLLTDNSSENAALRAAIALQLMGEAATLESNRIDGGARLLSLITGFAGNEDIEQNPAQALELFRMLIQRAFYHFYGLTSGYRTWSPDSDMQAQNQIVALYQLLTFVGLDIQAAIIKQIVTAADAEREFGIMLNCWNSGKEPNHCLASENEELQISEKELLAEFYDNYTTRSPKARIFEGIFEDAPVRFTEHRIRKDGNCGFTGLGIERGDAIMQLIMRAGDERVRALVAPDIRAAIIAGDWNGNYGPEAENARLLHEMGDSEALNAYVMREDIFRCFLIHYRDRTTWLSYLPGQTGMLDAIAYVKCIQVHIWTENAAGNLELVHQTAPVENPQGGVHLIHTDGLTHFNLLSLEEVD